MMPVGPLMIEHRLIEKMIKLIKNESQRILQEKTVDIVFIDRAVDFIRTYADRCHHGKEEEILFRDLAKKQLSSEHKKILDELTEEHNYARNMTKSIVGLKEKYIQGDKNVILEISQLMQGLAEFYPKHIEKEDKHFFLPCMNYFVPQEQDAMLKEFWEFDKQLIHEKYKTMVQEMGGGAKV
jgi:hemerythrin-like domain-containing protein